MTYKIRTQILIQRLLVADSGDSTCSLYMHFSSKITHKSLNTFLSFRPYENNRILLFLRYMLYYYQIQTKRL